MNISKRWKKFLLSTAAFFWAGCGGDSESIAPENEDIHSTQTGDSVLIGEGTVALYGVLPVFDPDSGKITSSDSCGDSCHAESSSSETNQSSSSEVAQSSSSKITGYGTYKLARDTSITCEVSETQTFILGSGRQSPEEIMDALENNKTLSVEELNELEDKLEFESLGYGTLYGVPYTSTGIRPSVTVRTHIGEQFAVDMVGILGVMQTSIKIDTPPRAPASGLVTLQFERLGSCPTDGLP